jgi:hypothetical protein
MTTKPTSTQFEDFVREVEERATPEERHELEAARARFKIGARILQTRLAAGLTQQQNRTRPSEPHGRDARSSRRASRGYSGSRPGGRGFWSDRSVIASGPAAPKPVSAWHTRNGYTAAAAASHRDRNGARGSRS